MKATKNYIGNKKINGFYHKIINEIPKHKAYYELFLGSGAIAKLLMEVCPKTWYSLNDKDWQVMSSFEFPSNIKIDKNGVSNIDAVSFLKLKEITTAGTDTFIFMDPPYLHSTRNSPNLYKFEMSDKDHVQLLKAVLQLKCNVMIVHPKCELYDKLLSDWRKVQVKVRYHNKTSIECLYMNYEKPIELQTYKYLGTDCWDRQRIKRKRDSLIKKLLALPVQERNKIIQSVIEIAK